MGSAHCQHVTAVPVRAVPIIASCHSSAEPADADTAATPAACGRPRGSRRHSAGFNPVAGMAHMALGACDSVERGCVEVDVAAGVAVCTVANGCTPLPARAPVRGAGDGGGLSDMALGLLPRCDSFSSLGFPSPRPGGTSAAPAGSREVPPFTSAMALEPGEELDPGGFCDEMYVNWFVAQVASGVGLVLLVDGVGGLAVRGTLDRHCAILRLAFMGVQMVQKDIPLSSIGDISVICGKAEWAGCKRQCLMVQLALPGSDLGTFLFDDHAQGHRDANYFAGCLRTLVKRAAKPPEEDRQPRVQNPAQVQELPDLVSTSPRAPLDEPLVSTSPRAPLDEPLVSLDA